MTERAAPSPAMYRQLRLCSGGGGFEAVPTRSLGLDLRRVRDRLEASGIPVVDARVVLIASMEVEVTVSRAGRLLFKTPDEGTAARAFERVLPLLGLGT